MNPQFGHYLKDCVTCYHHQGIKNPSICITVMFYFSAVIAWHGITVFDCGWSQRYHQKSIDPFHLHKRRVFVITTFNGGLYIPSTPSRVSLKSLSFYVSTTCWVPMIFINRTIFEIVFLYRSDYIGASIYHWRLFHTCLWNY